MENNSSALFGKKILFLVTEDWYFWLHRYSLAESLLETGMEVHVATREGEFKEKILQAGFKFYSLNMSRKSLNPFKRIMNVYNVCKIYSRIKPDIVHNVSIQPVFTGSLAAFFVRPGFVLNAFTGLGYIFLGKTVFRKTLRFFILQVMKFIFSKIPAIMVFENSDDKDVFLKNRIFAPERAYVFPGSGVDTEKFIYKKEDLDKSNVLLPARLLKDKGVLEYIDAAKKVLKVFPNVQFWIAGKSDQGNPTAISEKQVRSWEAEGVVKWLGDVGDMPSLYASANIVCLPSYREGMPMSLAEAASTGRALVATDVPGCREIVIPSLNGLLIPPQNSEELAKAILYLLENPNIREEMGKRGASLVREKFDKRIVIAKMKELYVKFSK